jgi:hypothetical protein
VRTVAATTASTTSPSTTEVALNDLTKQMSDLCKLFANNGPRIANGGMALTPEKSSSTMGHPSSMCQFWGQPSAPQMNLSATLPDASAPWLSDTIQKTPNLQGIQTIVQQIPVNLMVIAIRLARTVVTAVANQDIGNVNVQRKVPCPVRITDNARMGAITARIRPAEIYVDASTEGKKVVCLLDTGCERSLTGRKLIPERFLTGTNTNLFAANGTAIPVIGTTCLEFLIDGIKVTANLLVTEVLAELILGIDWLSSNRCQ